jgi:N6-L-threonylcarbamoyladenine synthase
MLALGYPGGPIIDKLAAHGNPSAVRFNEPKMGGNQYDFSFSGIKTAVLYYLRKRPELQPEIDARQQALARGERNADALRGLSSKTTLDLVASFQHAVVEGLIRHTLAAAEQFGAASVLVSGGVAANRELRARFEEESRKHGLETFFPSRALSTDNAAMIAAAAYPRLVAGERADASLNAQPNFPLGKVVESLELKV